MAQDPFAQYATPAPAAVDPFAEFAMRPVASHEPTPARTWTDTAVDALPFVGGAVGSLVGGAGGTVAGFGVGGVPGAMGGAAVGGAGGEAAKQLVNRLRGRMVPQTAGDAASDIGIAGAEQAAAEGGGRLLSGALRVAGRGMYRAGALPLQQLFSKHGDLIAKGIEARTPVTQAGLEKAVALKTSEQATKRAAISKADDLVTFRSQGLANDALAKVEGNADELRRAGLGDASKAHQARVGRIVSENGPGLKPSELEAIKSTVDDTLGPAYKRMRMREALSPNERMSMGISHAAGDMQSSVVQNYKGLNKNVMDAEGLRRMIARRLQGNQGLENALTMAVGPAAIPARLAMLPGVASTAGIATHMAGEHPAVMSNATRAALLALLSEHQPEQ